MDINTDTDILPSYEIAIDKDVINNIKSKIEKRLKSLKISLKIILFLYICLLITIISLTNFSNNETVKIILILFSFNHILFLFWIYFGLIDYIKEENELDSANGVSACYISLTITLCIFLICFVLIIKESLIFNWDLIFWLICGLFVVILSITSLICLLIYEIIKWFIIC